MLASTRVWIACAALMISACAQESAAPAGVDAPAADTGVDSPAPVVAPDGAAQAPDDDAVPAADMAAAGFDIAALPMSEQPLGGFPFFTIPGGAREAPNTARRLDFGEAVFWTGAGLQRVEGRVYATGIRRERNGAGSGGQFSDLEVVRNLQHVVTAAGGVEIASGQTPTGLRSELADVMRQYHVEATCYGHAAQQVFVLRRADGNVWVRTCRGGNFAGLIVLQEQPLEVTSTLLPASELQQALADTGRVALQVHFATDDDEILPDSQPQIDQIVELMRTDPALFLTIEGHTDNTGDAGRNQALSRARAASVVTALAGSGIAPARLVSDGFGDTRPVADNATDQGRALNRRVELVRRP